MYKSKSMNGKANINKVAFYNSNGVAVPKDICDIVLINDITKEQLTLGELLVSYDKQIAELKSYINKNFSNVSKILLELQEKINRKGVI